MNNRLAWNITLTPSAFTVVCTTCSTGPVLLRNIYSMKTVWYNEVMQEASCAFPLCTRCSLPDVAITESVTSLTASQFFACWLDLRVWSGVKCTTWRMLQCSHTLCVSTKFRSRLNNPSSALQYFLAGFCILLIHILINMIYFYWSDMI